MGKSTAASMLRRLGIPVHDSDAVVHRLLGPGGAAVPAVSAAFDVQPDSHGGLSRAELGKIVFGRSDRLRLLESILHPLVTRDRERFLQRLTRGGGRRSDLVVFDVPLLFETGSQHICDLIWVVSAPPLVQRQRYLSRPGVTEQRFAAILARQLPDVTKRRLAARTIPSGLGLAVTLRALRHACTLAKRANRRQLARQAAHRRLASAIARALSP